MAQRRVNIFGALIDTADLPEMVSHLMSPSRLLGNDFSVAAPDLMQISAGSTLLPDGVLIIESEVKNLVIPNSSLATDYTIIYQLEDTKTLGGSPAILRLISGTKRQINFTDATVLGWVRYPGGSVPLSSSFFIQPSPLRIVPHESAFYFTSTCPLQNIIKTEAMEPRLGTITVGSKIITGLGSTVGFSIGQRVKEILTDASASGIADNSFITGINTNQKGTLINANPTVTAIPTTAGLVAGQLVTGSGIPANTYILSVASPTSIVLTQAATLTGDTVLTFPTLTMSQMALSTGTIALVASSWIQTMDYPENEACTRFVNASSNSSTYNLKLPFVIQKSGQPRKLITRLFVDFNCFATFTINLRGNSIPLSPNAGLISNTGSLMTREFDIPALSLDWAAGGSAYINVDIEAQSSRGISIAYIGLTAEPTPFTLFT